MIDAVADDVTPLSLGGRRSGDTVAAPRTTAEQDRKTAGQRRVNILWELTQSLIAIAVTIATLYAAVTIVLRLTGNESAFLLLSNAFFLVIGFYFGRTNHQRSGGVGGDEVIGAR